MGSEHYCLRWNNHQSNLLGVFSQLLRDESLVDVTLACSEGHSIRAHRVVLSACSSYFQTLFVDHPSRHPIVILKDVRFAELRTLIEFMYKGEVNVEYCQLSALLKTAESLKVKGLAEMTNLQQAAANASMGSSLSRRDDDHTPPAAHMQQSSSLDRQQLQQASATERVGEQHIKVEREQQHIMKQQSAASTSDSMDQLSHRLSAEEQCISSSPPVSCASPLPHHRLQREPPPPASESPRSDAGGGGGGGSGGTMRLTDSPESMRSLSAGCVTRSAPNAAAAAATSGPSVDMCVSNNTVVTSCSGMAVGDVASAAGSSAANAGAPCSSRMASPHDEPVAGPSGLPPVQQVPLSLKKEVDWGGGMSDEKSTGESSTDYRHSYDPEMLDTMGSFPCMYCGASFPHQSKLTRHILSHSLETLKYREQLHQQHQAAAALGLPPLGVPPPGSEPPFGARAPLPPPHQLGDPHQLGEPPGGPADFEHAAAMELELQEAASMASGAGGSAVVMCKFCGKSFPDVGSLIAHLPAHSGERPFKCEFCGKAFKLRHHMKDHCRVHTGERPFRCALCGKTFSRSTILKAHEKTHYPKYVRKFLSPSPLDNEEESSPHQ